MIGLSYDLILALVGFLIMFGFLGGIGINKPRGMSVKMWCVGYLGVAIGFDVLAVIGLIGGSGFHMAHFPAGRIICRRRNRFSASCDASHQRRRCPSNNHGLKNNFEVLLNFCTAISKEQVSFFSFVGQVWEETA